MNANNTASRKNREQQSKEICLMARKPCGLRNLKEQIDREITQAEADAMVGTDKVLTATFKCWEEYDAADFSASQWWKVTLQKEHVELLVDTQGFRYPRYAGILQNA